MRYFIYIFKDAYITEIPAVGTRSLLLLETRVSQEVDKTARTHQVSIGTLWWKKKKKKKLRRHSVRGKRDCGGCKLGRGTGEIKIYELAQDGNLESWN